ncbi:MAG: hypothetical protein FJ290_20700 [Planctomycetes bacterium]|nr:hypothetical protein [Planctomycetota bacterium]
MATRGDVNAGKEDIRGAAAALRKTCQRLLAGERALGAVAPVDLDAIVQRWYAPFEDDLMSDGESRARRLDAMAQVVRELHEAGPWPLEAFHAAAVDWLRERILLQPGAVAECSTAILGVCEAIHNYAWSIDRLIEALGEEDWNPTAAYRPELVRRAIARGRSLGETSYPGDLIASHALLTAFQQLVPAPLGLLEAAREPASDPLWLAALEKLPQGLPAEGRAARQKRFGDLTRDGTLGDIRHDLVRLKQEIASLDAFGRFLDPGSAAGELPVRWLVALAAAPGAATFSNWASDTIAEQALRGDDAAVGRAVCLLSRVLDQECAEDSSAPYRIVARVLLALLCAADGAPAGEAERGDPYGRPSLAGIFAALSRTSDGQSLARLAVRVAGYARRAGAGWGRGAQVALAWGKFAARFFPAALADRLPGYVCLAQFLRGVVEEAERVGSPNALFCIPEAEARTTFTELCNQVLRFARTSPVPELEEHCERLRSNRWVQWLVSVEPEP